jgi:hypothetical protein
MFFEETLFAIRLPEAVFDNTAGATEQCCHVLTAATLKELAPELTRWLREIIKAFCKEILQTERCGAAGLNQSQLTNTRVEL